MRPLRARSALIVLACLAPAPLRAEDELFLPVARLLVQHCLECHSGPEPAASLDLTSLHGMQAGGESGERVLVPGQPDQSYLVHQVVSGSMPPAKTRRTLTEEERQQLVAWVAAGAPWPDGRVLDPYDFTTAHRAGRDWWSLQPVVRPSLPPEAADPWVRNPIDAFVLARLRAAGLEPSPEAERLAWLRRVTFDLIGLPPAPDEIEAFLADREPDAYERVVDRLLASPRYGERWARHWFDVARFAESAGYEVNTARTNAWPYRDYVIRALNEDRPYDQFVVDQLAGDQTGADAATGFLVAGPHDLVGIKNIEGQLQQRANDLDDIVSTTAAAFLGITMNCARCHDHKFDPITQTDYYGMVAVFAGVQHGERLVRLPGYEERLRYEPQVRKELAAAHARMRELLWMHEPVAGSGELRPAVNALGNVDRFTPIRARRVRFTILATSDVEPCLDELEVYTAEREPRNVALAAAGGRATASSVYANGALEIHQLSHVNDGLYGNGRSWISAEPQAGWVEIELAEEFLIDRVAWARDREGKYADRLATRYRIEVASADGAWQVVATSDDRAAYRAGQAPPPAEERLPPEAKAELDSLRARIEELEAALPEAATMSVYAGTFKEPEPVRRLHRGEVMQPREVVPPGAVAALGRWLELDPAAAEKDRRLALARWIAHRDNPRTARVMVNRLWHYHFGRGLVATPNDLGWHGGLPSHPELLDWLADEFVSQGWSIKAMHRLMVLSATYRQESAARAECMAVDADNRLLWRFAPRRLEAECIRDAVLWASGVLDLRMGGPGYDAFEPNSNYVKVYIPKTNFGPAEWRRMVYESRPRMVPEATFGMFDCPDASRSQAQRPTSLTPLQALSLLNSPFVVQQAELFAARLRAEAPNDPSAQIRRAFLLAFGRAPDDAELEAALSALASGGLEAVCRALYNANEFLYVH